MSPSLPRSRPSAQNVDAQGVLDYLDAVAGSGLDLHSMMLLRRGTVVAEGWWKPYQPDGYHLLYSLSKSFTSTAIGIAEGEGLLSVDDLVIDHFPDQAPAEPSPYLRRLRVRDLLAMASGHQDDTAERLREGGPDLVRTFLSLPLEHEPGTHFCYNQGCTHTLAALIVKRSGQSLLDYLRPRLFDPLGIGEVYWALSPDGIEMGYSGFHATTEAIATLGQLYLQRGRWGDRQLLPERYVAQATQKQVDNRHHSENPDWQEGYGFQFWCCRHDAFRGDGAFGQFCVVMPAQDAVFVCTAESKDMQVELEQVWTHLLPALRERVGEQEGAEQRLQHRLQREATPLVEAKASGPKEPVAFEPAPSGIPGLGRLRVHPGENGPRLSIAHEEGELTVELHSDRWAAGELPGVRALLPPVAVSGGWVSGHEFRADVVFITSPHRLHLRGTVGGAEAEYQATWEAPPLH